MKNPEDLTDTQAAQLAKIRRTRGGIWRAYEMKEQFRAVFAGDLEPAEAIVLLDRWIIRASRSRLAPFVKAAKTVAAGPRVKEVKATFSTSGGLSDS